MAYAVLNNPFKYAVIGNQMCVYQQPDYTPTVYGYLYNHFAATDASFIAAEDWSIPTVAFLGTLRVFIGNDASMGVFLKSCRTVNNPAGGDCSTNTHPRWDDPTTAFPPATFSVAGIDSYNFGAVPSGVRYDSDSSFSELGQIFGMWLFDITSTEGETVQFTYNDPNGFFRSFSRKYGLAIRLARFATAGEQSTLSDGDYADDYIGNDGRRYKTVKIGTQIWMAENLAETRYRDGTPIPTVTDQTTWNNLATGAKCVYDNNSIYL